MKLHNKWLLLVGLNSLLGFFLGNLVVGRIGSGGFDHFAGMILGILTWFWIYYSLDKFLLNTGKLHISKKLTTCVLIKAALQFLVMPEMIAGTFAGLISESIGLSSNTSSTTLHFNLVEFLYAYVTTVLTGLFLSLFCSVIYLMISLITAFNKSAYRDRVQHEKMN